MQDATSQSTLEGSFRQNGPRRDSSRRSAFTFCISKEQATHQAGRVGVEPTALAEGGAGAAEEDHVVVGFREARGNHPNEARDDERGVPELPDEHEEEVEDVDEEADVRLRVYHVIAERGRAAEDVDDVRGVREGRTAGGGRERGAEEGALLCRMEKPDGARLDRR